MPLMPKSMTSAMILAVLLLKGLSAGEDNHPAIDPPHHIGIEMGSNAAVFRDGKPYRGIGVNYFDCFLRTLKSGDDTSYDAGFATLAQKDIPFARFCATGFWPSDMKLYAENRPEYFRRLDGVVASARKHDIGLVPSLFWSYSCVPDLAGESIDQWANPQSKTHAWMREYVREVVTRYRDNPAIWAWEFGNEYSLSASLPDAKEHRPPTHPTLGTPAIRSAHDDMTFATVRAACSAFAAEVRKYDAHRLICTGDAFPRASAWHQEHESSWKQDTPEQLAEMLAKSNPDSIDSISLHAYDDDDKRLAMAMKSSRRIGKPIFVGEFGACGENPEVAPKYRRLLQAMLDNDVPLAALWVFDFASQKEFNVTPTNSRSWQLDLISEANMRLHAESNPAK
jgi:endo-1,4-beta-mannosidase